MYNINHNWSVFLLYIESYLESYIIVCFLFTIDVFQRGGVIKWMINTQD